MHTRKSFKRIQMVVILFAVLTLVLSACTGSQTTPPTTGNSSQASSTTAANQTVTVKVGYALDPSLEFQGNETIDNNSWTELYGENGIKLEIVYNVESSQGSEKLAQMIMSGDYPDVMNVANSNFIDWAQQGVFADLTDYIDEYASDLTKAYYETDYGKKALASATVDGKIYAMPAASAGYDGLPVLWVRQDWLDNLNMQAPTTTEEFYNLAVAFTENDPDKNGNDDTYGLALNGKDVFTDHGGVDQFFQMFGAVPGVVGGTIPFIDNDGHAVYGGSLVDENTQALQMLVDMYNNNYISKDFITAGSEQVNQVLSSGQCGMIISRMYTMGTPWANALETQPDAEFVAVPLPGVTADAAGSAFYTATPASFYCLSSKSPDKIKEFFTMVNLGVAYLAQPDTLSQEEYEKYNGLPGSYTGWQLCLTPYGNPIKNLEALAKHHKALETGDTSGLNAENLRDYNAMKSYLDNIDRRAELDETELSAFNTGLFFYSVWGSPDSAYQAISDMNDKGNILWSAYDAPLTDAMIEYSTTLDTLAKETVISIITGNKGVDTYAEFLETWNSLGGSTITEEADAWYQSVK